jgi:type IV secretion system protein VirD4
MVLAAQRHPVVGNLGTSRWQTEKERDANNSVWKYEKEPIKTAGIVLGADLKRKRYGLYRKMNIH